MVVDIAYWLITVPIEGPLRAAMIVAEMLGLALVLHGLWEIGFVVVKKSRVRGR